MFCLFILNANVQAGILARIDEIVNQGPGYVCEKNGEYWAEQQLPDVSNCQKAANYGEAKGIAVQKNIAAQRDREMKQIATVASAFLVLVWALRSIWRKRRAQVLQRTGYLAGRVVGQVDEHAHRAVSALGHATAKAERKAGSLAEAFKEGRARAKEDRADR
jgi:hypothetical protein